MYCIVISILMHQTISFVVPLYMYDTITVKWMKLNFLQESSFRLEVSVFHMWRYYNIERMRRGYDYYLLQSNSSYVSTWSAVLCFVILMAGYLQLFFLKRLFNTNPITEMAKPRCWSAFYVWWRSKIAKQLWLCRTEWFGLMQNTNKQYNCTIYWDTTEFDSFGLCFPQISRTVGCYCLSVLTELLQVLYWDILHQSGYMLC